MRFQVGDHVLVYATPERIVSLGKSSALLTDGNRYGLKWLAQWLRGYWESRADDVGYNGVRSWSHRDV